MPRLSKIGAAALAAFGWTGISSVTASYLVVAGGGGGGGYNNGGGGGAGGLQSGITSLNPTLSYTITVGAGGTGGATGSPATGSNGSNSQLGSLTASVGGGYGGGFNGSSSYTAANSGGSGGGGGAISGPGASGTSGQGNAGGNGVSNASGGGGGAGAIGGNGGGTNVSGNGGNGTASSISGSSITYAGGGGGSAQSTGTQGTGGTGGGGNGTINAAGNAGTANLGGGGGGLYSGSSYAGGSGGSGVVIISYPAPQQFGGGVVTTSGSNVIHTFNTSGTLTPLSSLTASYLVVAGGGGGSSATGAGGSGAGGLLSGSGLTIDTNSNYLVTVGAGGAGGGSSAVGLAGGNSSFSMVTTTAIGGGRGGITSAGFNGTSGGSGGGGNYVGTGGAGTSGQGNAGGNGTGFYFGGGGGGAGAVGGNGVGTVAGSGGVGVASSISGTSTYYAGGGGGAQGGGGTAGAGGNGGGGAGGADPSTAGGAGTANTGGGAGASGYNIAGNSGGSGVVIISYAGSTQQMAGGTVTISGGNVIHTFTSSGYLTPIKYVNNSLRFRSSAQSYLSRTLTTPTNNKKWSYSVWMKRGSLSANRTIMSSNVDGAEYWDMRFNTSDQIYIQNRVGSSNLLLANTTAVYRDPAAWYHIVFVFDSANATAANRNLLYVNGVNVSLSANSGSSDASAWNTSGVQHNIGVSRTLTTGGAIWAEYDGYETEVNFIDGQALTPNSFGTFNSYGVWQPITYGGSYGTNGFYLPFTNKTSTTTLGYDFSPNGNNWTTNNISLTAGSTYDSMTDVPTLTSATAANYCVMNPLTPSASLSYANLRQNTASPIIFGTMGVSTGKWYFEITLTTQSTAALKFGIANSTATGELGDTSTGWGYIIQSNGNNGQGVHSGSTTSTYLTFATGDVLNVAFDVDAGKIWWGRNGTWANSGVPSSGTGAIYTDVNGTVFPAGTNIDKGGGAGVVDWNFGQRPFTYTPPTGFVALNTYNL